MIRGAAGAVGLALLFGHLVGCGGSGTVKMSTVSGAVTLDGQPLAEGTISFNPVDGATPTAGGKITNGSYSAEVPRGLQKVVISAQKVTGSRKLYESDPNSPVINTYAEALPARYSSPLETTLTVDVGSSSVQQDFPLTSMP